MNITETGLLLRLFHARGIGSALLRRVLTAGAGAEINEGLIVQSCTDKEERQAVLSCLRAVDHEQARQQSCAIEATLRWLECNTHHLLSVNDADYPPLLRQIPDYPPLLFVKGDVASLRRPMLAIVGSRSSTAYGRSVAYRIAAGIADMGLLVCSGLASGIDTQAHIAALDAGSNTVAVLGNGLASVYPTANRKLADRIVDTTRPVGGALLSEMPLDAGPVASHFPQRNRIISGMSLGVCVVEANMRSGSLITARLALEQNRDVFAVPGSINSPVSRGCHRLLRHGAVLTESAHDIVEHIRTLCQAQMAMAYPDFKVAASAPCAGHPMSSSPTSLPAFLSNPAARCHATSGSTHSESLPDGCQTVYAELCQDATTVDALLVRTGMAVAELSEKLLQLELAGFVSRQGNRWQRQ